MNLTVIEKNGWRKPLKIEKGVIRIGRDPSNDISLDSPQISPVHLQVHYLPNESECRVLNLGGDVLISRGDSKDALLPYTKAQVRDGDEVLLGEYRIAFSLPLTVKTVQEADSIKASLSFPYAEMQLHGATSGWLSVQNIGEQSPCQFHISVSGLPDDCVKIDPVPLLYSGAEEEVIIQLFHRIFYPSAGLKDLIIRISAPAHYPGEQVVLKQGIYVAPVFEQSLDLIDDLNIEEKSFVANETVETDIDEGAEPESVSDAPPVLSGTQVEVREKVESFSEAPKDEEQQVVDVAENPDENLPPEEEEIQVDDEVKKKPGQSPIIQEENLEVVEREEEAEDLEAPIKKVAIKPVIVRSLPEDFWDDE